MSSAPKVVPKINQLHPFLNSAVILNLSNGVVETLSVMAQVTSTFEKSFVEKNWKSPADISVYINLESPPCKGQVRFHFTRNVLLEVYKRMMKEEVAADSQELVDSLGEISNMCYGHAKGKLNNLGYALKMALPHPSKTADMPAVISQFPHIVIPFKVLNETCYIQIVIF